MRGKAVPPDRREDAQNDAEEDRKQARNGRQFQRGRSALGQNLGHGPRLPVAHPEIAFGGIGEKLSVLHDERLIEPELTAQPLDIRIGALLPQHVVDRVADEAEHPEGHQPDDEKDNNGLENTLDGEGEHRTSDPRYSVRRRLHFTVTQRRMKKLSGRCVSSMLSRVPQISGCT